MKQRSSNVRLHDGDVTRSDRETILGQRGCVVWFTGLSGSGKSTLARALEARLAEIGRLVYVLDGDNLRHGLNGDLGFSAEDRVENIRRVGEVSALFGDTGTITLVAFISPYRADRELARRAAEGIPFFEVFVDTPLDVCEKRDPKGLYKKARAGEIGDFTGISAPYESPESPEFRVETTQDDIRVAVAQLETGLREAGILT